MWLAVRPAIVVLLALTLLTGVIYSGLVTIVGQTFFARQANGSLIYVGGQAVGSALIGQSFAQPQYFWGRLSATAPVPYHAAASAGSNYGPLHPALRQATEARIAALREAGSGTTLVPVDLVTASASGLDPHISPAAAEYQVARVARARRLEESVVRDLVHRHTHARQWGILGEPRVDVLALNLALDEVDQTTRLPERNAVERSSGGPSQVSAQDDSQ